MKKLIFAAVAFLLIGAGMIAYNLGTDFGEKGDAKAFLGAFGSWIKQVGASTKNVAGAAVGAAVRQEWLPDINKTINKTEVE